MPILEIKALSARYYGQKDFTFEDISIELEEGEILALTGESGSGKSSLLRTIAGLEEPVTGSIIIDKEFVVPPSQKLVPGHPDISLVFQQFDIEPNLTVSKNIDTLLREYTKEYREALIKELLWKCKIDHLKDKKPFQLSGGEQQRLAIARAISRKPKLLLMDEPFSNQDVSLKELLKDTLYDLLKKYRLSTIIVTHDTRDALSMSDRLVLIKNGKILQNDRPEKVYFKPVNREVAAFFGTSNFLESKELAGLRLPKRFEGTTICLRAEMIRIVEVQEGFVVGTIVHTSFYGPEWEYRITTGSLTLKVLTRSKAGSRKGEKVGLVWDWENAISLES